MALSLRITAPPSRHFHYCTKLLSCSSVSRPRLLLMLVPSPISNVITDWWIGVPESVGFRFRQFCSLLPLRFERVLYRIKGKCLTKSGITPTTGCFKATAPFSKLVHRQPTELPPVVADNTNIWIKVENAMRETIHRTGRAHDAEDNRNAPLS